MGENQEKIETLEQSKQAEQDPDSEQNQEGQHPEQPAPSREKGQQDEPPITEEEEELALELERFSTMYSTMAKMTIKMNDRLGLILATCEEVFLQEDPPQYRAAYTLLKLVERFSPEDQRDPETLQKTLADCEEIYIRDYPPEVREKVKLIRKNMNIYW